MYGHRVYIPPGGWDEFNARYHREVEQWGKSGAMEDFNLTVIDVDVGRNIPPDDPHWEKVTDILRNNGVYINDVSTGTYTTFLEGPFFRVMPWWFNVYSSIMNPLYRRHDTTPVGYEGWVFPTRGGVLFIFGAIVGGTIARIIASLVFGV